MEKVDIKSMDITELQELLQELGEPKFRAKQLFDWLHAKQVDSFAEMTNLSKSLREKLGETAAINGVKIVRRLVSQIDGTRKPFYRMPERTPAYGAPDRCRASCPASRSDCRIMCANGRLSCCGPCFRCGARITPWPGGRSRSRNLPLRRNRARRNRRAVRRSTCRSKARVRSPG